MKGKSSDSATRDYDGRNEYADRREQRRQQRLERSAARNAVSASILVLLALVLLAVGVGGGFLLTRSRIPSSLRSTAAAGSIRVEAAPFEDARSVSLKVSLGSSSTVTMPKGGTVTASTCVPGNIIASGGSVVELDAVSVLALHTQTPLYRTLTSGTEGSDARSLNQALRALGYGAPDSSQMTWHTITAYNALAKAVGAQQLTAETNWAIGPDSFMWLPVDSLTIASCAFAVGQQASPGQVALTSAATPVKASLPTDSGGAVAGDRTIVINGQTFEVPAGSTELTDSALLSAIAGSTEYRLAALDGGNSAAVGADLSSDSANAGGNASSNGSLNVSYTWKLKTPINAVTVPPSAVTHAAGGAGCVVTSGKSVPVRIISSQLGKTMIEAENDANLTTVEVKPASAEPCR